MKLAFYIHVPYCSKRCGYCDFNTYTPTELKISTGLNQISNSYIDLVIKEIELAKFKIKEPVEVSSIFFGGGTPSLMEPVDLGRVVTKIKTDFGISSNAEITLEVNPDSVDRDKLELFFEIGINRLSIGMQSAVSKVLKILDRTHNPENVSKVVNWATDIGFKQISVDLIYGTPGESKEDWQQSIDAALALPISHISAYALIVEPGTKLAAQIKRGEMAELDDDLTAEKYLMADQAFTNAGFYWYELSNWAKDNSKSRHNLSYWLGDNWLGIGPGAHSHIDGERYWNVKHPTLYKEKIEKGQLPIADSEILDSNQIESERLMLSIRLTSGIETKSLNMKQITDLSGYVESGHLNHSDWQQGRATLTLNGRLIADRIVREILL
ncbi:MAG: coproporphyrinogen III oxidase [Actinobacteria bacterium]|nr:coproporphyrinogen III oxidase [Actinomycetota bacterium]NCU78076.1 coproporphyrinogen III oxidase [Actinomycetota bacterium]NCU96035.1 coproporphyrinogen III oxidase [Actinomycetota bacterium]NCZ76462.1 coproporphyrinogen III oxidase [Actinomycetota bacterium]